VTDNYKLSDELLKKLATGSGRVYPFEGRAMAAELIEFRRARADADAAKAAQTFPHPPGLGGIPYP
jgi:hypothetical protein